MRTAVGFALGAFCCFGFLAREPRLSVLAAVGLLLALAAEFMEDEDGRNGF